MERVIALFNQLEIDDMLTAKQLVETNFKALVTSKLDDVYNNKLNTEAEKVIALVRKYKLTIHTEKGVEVKPSFKAPKKAKAEPKYRNPDNHEDTWAGHGRKPMWLKDRIESGKSLEDFKINN